VLRSEPSRRECVALARLARQPVPHAVSLAGRPRKQRGQSCISRAPAEQHETSHGAGRAHSRRRSQTFGHFHCPDPYSCTINSVRLTGHSGAAAAFERKFVDSTCSRPAGHQNFRRRVARIPQRRPGENRWRSDTRQRDVWRQRAARVGAWFAIISPLGRTSRSWCVREHELVRKVERLVVASSLVT
jgi:hypothetical protein